MAEADSFAPTSRWFIAAGTLTTARAFLELTEPAYYSPESFLDYAAVILTSLALLGFAGGLLSMWGRRPIRRGSFLLLIAGLGITVEALGNFLEDVMDLEVGGHLYTIGGITGAISLLIASIAVLTVGHLRWVGVFLLATIAGSVFPDDGGQFVTGISLVGLGVWLRRRR